MTFELVTTKECNLNCKYCFEGKKQKHYLSVETIPSILKFINTYIENDFIYNKNIIKIDFNGGEALLNKKFITEFINITKNNGYNYSITTNGILIDDSLIELINKHKIDIQMSLDGKEKTHNLNRKFYNEQGSFDITFSKAKKLKERFWKKDFSISLVFTPDTVSYLAENIEYLLENGFHNISFCACLDYKWDANNIKEFGIQIKKIGKTYIEFLEKGEQIYLSQINNAIDIVLHNYPKPQCSACTDTIAILPNGNILPCGGFVGCENEDEIVIGNINKTFDLAKISDYLSPQQFITQNEECNSCILNKRCHHDCFAVNNRIMHNKYKTCPDFCKLNQLSIMEADLVTDHLIRTKNKTFLENYNELFKK
ncbi:MAG: radical SAM protein [Treponema sp.]|nr:radical SAM protein [Treponema sp.]